MITAKGLTKTFGNFQALKGLDMQVKAGEIYGFIGQNGAGKTTTMNILAGLLRSDEGKCYVNGKDVDKISHPGCLNIGYLPEDPKFYPWMNARETLHYLSNNAKPEQVDNILKWTGLTQAAHRRVGGFSRGMRQRLGMGVALIRNPEIFILDEPSSALDPEGRMEVLNLIKDLKDMSKTILFSTHILDDVERICDLVGMIEGGKMLFEKPLHQLHQEYKQPLFDISPMKPVDPLVIDELSKLTDILSVVNSENKLTIRAMDKSVSIGIMKFFSDREIPLESFVIRKTRLEDLFLQEVPENEG